MTEQTIILIVEDELRLLEVSAKILTRKGYQVETSAYGSDAIGKLDSFFPDIVLLDISLPDMNGFDILSIIRSEKRFQQIFVIICTGMMTSMEHRNYGLESGADDYLYKPLTADALLARVKAMVRIKKTEHQLRNINKTLDALKTAQKIANMGSFFTPLDTNTLNCSDGLYRLFGYVPGEIKMNYQFLLDHIFSKDINRFKEDLKSFLKTQPPLTMNTELFVKKDPSGRFGLLPRQNLIKTGIPGISGFRNGP